MSDFERQISFILNDETIRDSPKPGLLALDYIRHCRRLTGTKEGCKEGDCGACVTLLGELDDGGRVRYRPVTSCLLPAGELQGKHLVTIEGLNGKGLSPVQAAMAERGGSQCGYCTPGFVVALTAGLMNPRLPLNREGAAYAISGNLCRCTGYRPIKEAALDAMKALEGKLGDEDRVGDMARAGALPAYFKSIPKRLRELRQEVAARPSLPDSPFAMAARGRLPVAGGTDLYVQRGDAVAEADTLLLNAAGEPKSAQRRGRWIVLDPRMTFEGFAEDPLVLEQIPRLPAFMRLISSWPVRERSSLGGNICNASPIADLTCLLLALEAEIELCDGEARRRRTPLMAFFIEYKKLDKRDDELISEIAFPALGPGASVNFEKVSKRAWLDIASVNTAAKIETANSRISSASLSIGGVGPTPLHLAQASASLAGKPPTVEAFLEAAGAAEAAIAPISDIRGSALYKRLLARQLILAHGAVLFPETVTERNLHAAL